VPPAVEDVIENGSGVVEGMDGVSVALLVEEGGKVIGSVVVGALLVSSGGAEGGLLVLLGTPKGSRLTTNGPNCGLSGVDSLAVAVVEVVVAGVEIDIGR
jgi:hypothetical protein